MSIFLFDEMNGQSALASYRFETTTLAVGGRDIFSHLVSCASVIIYKSDKAKAQRKNDAQD